MENERYYHHIDGLRAVSIIFILFYHAGFQPAKYGFIGVDVFFVISGYLITLSIARDRNFTYRNFYERRIRRILPALFFMCFIASIFAWILLTPKELKDYGRSLFSSVNMFSNFYFYKTQTYHEQISQLKPLIHTWSLSVEEQFYIIFPVLFIFARKKGYLTYCLLLCALFSLLFQIITSHMNKEAVSFYFPLSRAWEFILGSLGALLQPKFLKITPKFMSTFLSNFGFAFILLAALIPINSPSILQNILSSIGAILVILYASTNNLTGKILIIKPLRIIGLSSFSIYLYHQPIFSFYRYTSYSIDNLTYILLILSSIFLGFASYSFIEKPFKKISINFLYKILFLLWVLLSIIGLSYQFFEGYPDRYSDENQKILSYQQYDYKSSLRSDVCLISDKEIFSSFPLECYGGKPDNLTTILWGDSHAAGLYTGFSKFRNKIAQFTTSGCPPLIDSSHFRPLCNQANKWVLKEISKIKPNEIFLHADWSSYNLESLERILYTINIIKETSPESKVMIIGNTPRWHPSLPIYIVQYLNSIDNHEYIVPHEMRKSLDYDVKIKAIISKSDVSFTSALNILCKDTVCKFKVIEGNQSFLMFYDSEHLTKEGSIYLSDKILNK